MSWIIAQLVAVLGLSPFCQSGSGFVAVPVHQSAQTVYGMAFGEFDPGHPGGEVACLTADASVVQLSPDGLEWNAILRHKGLTPIQGMIDRPTIAIGDAVPALAGLEILIDGGAYTRLLYPSAGWSHEVLFTVGHAGAGWGSRMGDVDPAQAGQEILHSYEGVMDCGTIGIFRPRPGGWQEEIVYSEQVVMDSAVGEFDAAHPGPEAVLVTEMGPTYAIYPPNGGGTGLWPRRTLWNNMSEAGWVVRIADVDPGRPGNEIVYGTRYSNRITMSYPAGPGGHQLEILFTGIAPAGYATMYDIAIGDVLPPAGNEILGVDHSGSVYLVARASTGWQGRTVWRDLNGALHAVLAADFLPEIAGDEILVAGHSGTVTLLFRRCPADFDGDGRVHTADLEAFLQCAAGPGSAPAEGCPLRLDEFGFIPADFDRDGDVDQNDFGVFQRCLSGAWRPADPACVE